MALVCCSLLYCGSLRSPSYVLPVSLCSAVNGVLRRPLARLAIRILSELVVIDYFIHREDRWSSFLAGSS